MKRPAFQFYPADWLSGTILLTPAQKGAYIDLLCYAWLEEDCGLPDDDRKLAVLSGLRSQWAVNAADIREKFTAREGRLYNDKLVGIREKLDEFIRRSSEAGKQSAKVRATKNQPTFNQPSIAVDASVESTLQPNVNSSSLSSSLFSKEEKNTKKENTQDPRGDELFERIYKLHPKKGHRSAAEMNLAQSVSSGADPDEIERIHRLWCETQWAGTQGRFAPFLDQWLVDQGWKYLPTEGTLTLPGNGGSGTGSPAAVRKTDELIRRLASGELND